MTTAALTLRPATAADAQMLFDWRNDAATRKNSRDSAPIERDQHETWFARVLGSSDHVVRIAEIGGRPIGIVRAVRMDRRWELSWTVAPQDRGQGLGACMLKAFAARLDGILIAVIRKDNRASARIAASAGLTLKGDAPDKGFEVWTRE